MELIYSRQSIKSLKNIPNPSRTRIQTGINNLPNGDIKKLQGYVNSYRLRVGDYRVLFTINENLLIIDDVLPRGDAYKG